MDKLFYIILKLTMETPVKQSKEEREPTQIQRIQFVMFNSPHSRTFRRFDFLYINCDGKKLLEELPRDGTPMKLSPFMQKGRPRVPPPQNADQSVVSCGGQLLVRMPIPTKPWWGGGHNKDRNRLLESLLNAASEQNYSLTPLPTEDGYADAFRLQCTTHGFDPDALIAEVQSAVNDYVSHNIALEHMQMDLESTVDQISDMDHGGLLVKTEGWNFAQVEALILGLTNAGFVSFGEQAYTRIYHVTHPNPKGVVPSFWLNRLAVMCEYTGQKG